MSNIYSNIINFNSNSTKKIIKILSKNGIIGLPTETVYGIAGNAYSDSACKKIFNLKKRPTNNPLIIHYYNLEMLKGDCDLNGDFLKLYKRFCPGPITFILNKKNLGILKILTMKVRLIKVKIFILKN